MRRVVVTGMGCVTSLGADLDSFWSALLRGEQGISPLPDIQPGDLRFTHAAQVHHFDPADYLAPDTIKISERSSQFALIAAQQAIHQAAWKTSPPIVATILGCSTGGRSIEEPETAMLYRTGGRVHPLTVPRAMASSGTALLAMQHGFGGPAFTLSTACASGAHAIGLAFQAIRSGSVDAAVTGGHEAPLTYGFLKAWDSLRVVSKTGCRPFAADRDGMTLGEGAAMLVLESYDYAMQRNAKILGEIVGFGMSCDASHMTQPSGSGAIQAMQAAMLDARITPDQVGHINAHGTGTVVNDEVEAKAIHAVFGARACALPVTSTKAAHGHAMGASGAMEAIATIQALREAKAPPTAGVVAADSALHLDVVLETPRILATDFALSNSFAFGGMNAVLAFRSIH
jgi:nodulation protein E